VKVDGGPGKAAVEGRGTCWVTRFSLRRNRLLHENRAGTVTVMDTALPRVRRFAVSTRTFRRLSLTSAVMLVVIVASGATVRMTGSGLGCEHWPGCQAGDPFPKTGYHSYVEFSNRLVASVAIIATLATFLASLLAPGVRHWARWVAGLAFLGTLLQAPLGAITVYYKLNPWLVGSHFLLSIVVLALGVLVALEAWNVRGEPVTSSLRGLALLAGVACGALILSGITATAAGPHSGGVEVPRVWKFQPAVYVHVRATAVFAISFALLVTFLGWRGSRHLRGALVVLGLLIAQMIVGEVQYRTELPLGLVILHVTLSAIVWAATVVVVATMWRPERRAAQ